MGLKDLFVFYRVGIFISISFEGGCEVIGEYNYLLEIRDVFGNIILFEVMIIVVLIVIFVGGCGIFEDLY